MISSLFSRWFAVSPNEGMLFLKWCCFSIVHAPVGNIIHVSFTFHCALGEKTFLFTTRRPDSRSSLPRATITLQGCSAAAVVTCSGWLCESRTSVGYSLSTASKQRRSLLSIRHSKHRDDVVSTNLLRLISVGLLKVDFSNKTFDLSAGSHWEEGDFSEHPDCIRLSTSSCKRLWAKFSFWWNCSRVNCHFPGGVALIIFFIFPMQKGMSDVLILRNVHLWWTYKTIPT